MCWPLIGFSIKRKFQDTTTHLTSLALVVERWRHLLTPQRNDYRLSIMCGRSHGENSFTCTNEGLYIAKGETDLCDSSTFLMTIRHAWLFNFIYGTLGHPHYITLITTSVAQTSYVVKATHDTTRYEIAQMNMLNVVSLLSSYVVGWWVCSWCIISSPLHDKFFRVSDGLGIGLMVQACVCISFTCYFICFACSSNHEQVFYHAFLLHFVCHRIMLHSCTFLCNHSWWDDIKYINLQMYHDALFSVIGPGHQEGGQGSRDARLQGRVGRNYTEVTRRLIWAVQSNNGIWRRELNWEEELCNFFREAVRAARSSGSENYVLFPRRSRWGCGRCR